MSTNTRPTSPARANAWVRHIEAQASSGHFRPAMPEHYVIEFPDGSVVLAIPKEVHESLARAALTAALGVDELARVDAETTRCSWSIPRDGHPYNESCLYKRDRIDGQVSHGACWDAPYARATAIRAALLGGAA